MVTDYSVWGWNWHFMCIEMDFSHQKLCDKFLPLQIRMKLLVKVQRWC